jgi:hypothetical protein
MQLLELGGRMLRNPGYLAVGKLVLSAQLLTAGCAESNYSDPAGVDTGEAGSGNCDCAPRSTGGGAGSSGGSPCSEEDAGSEPRTDAADPDAEAPDAGEPALEARIRIAHIDAIGQALGLPSLDVCLINMKDQKETIGPLLGQVQSGAELKYGNVTRYIKVPAAHWHVMPVKPSVGGLFGCNPFFSDDPYYMPPLAAGGHYTILLYRFGNALIVRALPDYTSDGTVARFRFVNGADELMSLSHGTAKWFKGIPTGLAGFPSKEMFADSYGYVYSGELSSAEFELRAEQSGKLTHATPITIQKGEVYSGFALGAPGFNPSVPHRFVLCQDSAIVPDSEVLGQCQLFP